MYVSSCPLRVSLFGGSTDNPYFVEKYGYGAVISFTCDLKTYITLHEDKFGYNMQGHKYIVNYSKREETEFIGDIKNELVRVVLNHFGCFPLTVSMTSDAYSQGSGLASSSSYLINLIKCVSMFKDLNMTDIEICSLAYDLEREFNPYCGYQDPYGCGIGGFKRIEFQRGGIVKYDFQSTELFEHYDAHLVFTGVTRNSKNVLKDVSDNLDKIPPLLDTLEVAYDSLLQKNYDEFLYHLNQSWIQKKQTSSSIDENPMVKSIDEYLLNSPLVVAHKLCGAGNGGFFLTFSEKDKLTLPYSSVKINVSPDGVKGKKTMITLETDHPVAIESPDHISPVGTVNDNTTDADYIAAVKKHFGRPIKMMDLGCAGGQLVVDFIESGDYGVGLEGSTNARERGAGKHNWDKYGDKNLFTVDLTKPYQLYDDGEEVKFDFITTWEVVEHIAEEDLPMFFGNIKKHLKDDGVFCCSIAVVRDDVGYIDGKLVSRHQSVFNSAKWINILFDNGFELAVDPSWPAAPAGLEYAHHPDKPAGVVAKPHGLFFGYLFGDAMFRNHNDRGNSIYFCLTKKS